MPSPKNPLGATSNIAILIPAAGASSRMGTPKQLLPWGNSNLISHCVATANDLNCFKTVVVLGANFEDVQKSIQNEAVSILNHKDWKNGLGSSISFGIKHISQHIPKADGVLILLADQPLMDLEYLSGMIANFKPGQQQIIATGYSSERQGVPALFDSFYFAELSSINDDKGAKDLIKSCSEKVVSIAAEGKTADIDTLENYRRLYRANHQW